MRLYVASESEKFPLHAQIYEVDGSGKKYFINRINFTARHWRPGDAEWIGAEGIPHAHMFSAGSRIRIELTNIDKTNRPVMGIYPFVLPLFAKSSVTVSFGADHPSYIELPVTTSLH